MMGRGDTTDQERFRAEFVVPTLIPLHRRFFALGYSAEDAEDARNEIYVRAWRKLSEYDPKIASPTQFVLGFVTFVVKERLRARRARKRWMIEYVDPRPGEDGGGSPLQNAPDDGVTGEMHVDCQRVARALDALNETDRIIVVLHVLDELSFAEIAAVVDMSKSRTAARFHEAVQVVRKALDGVRRPAPRPRNEAETP